MEKITIVGKKGTEQIDVTATDLVSDGYHTFGELYDHRITLFIALCRTRIKEWVWDSIHQHFMPLHPFAWRSKAHHTQDQPMYEGWFVMGINKESGEQITYHLPLSRWEETDFAETLDHAPKWDGHTPADTIERLKKL